MKRRDNRSISAALAAATCSLLGGGIPAPVDAQEEPAWDFNTSLLYYGEDDDRVKDYSVSAIARRMFVDDRFLTIGLTVDVLTGATPNGAIITPAMALAACAVTRTRTQASSAQRPRPMVAPPAMTSRTPPRSVYSQ